MKRICALTMVRNDDFYLKKWVEYYGSELGVENLYIYLDGKDQEIPEWCAGTNITAVDKIPEQVVEAEKGRLDFLSAKAAELLGSYDLVIGVDADEILVVDPDLGVSLKDYLSASDIDVSLSGLGVDVGQHTGEDKDCTGGQSNVRTILAKCDQRKDHRSRLKIQILAIVLYDLKLSVSQSPGNSEQCRNTIDQRRQRAYCDQRVHVWASVPKRF